MSKMTKAQARRRLKEASSKIAKVYLAYFTAPGLSGVNMNDIKKLNTINQELVRIAAKMK